MLLTGAKNKKNFFFGTYAFKCMKFLGNILEITKMEKQYAQYLPIRGLDPN